MSDEGVSGEAVDFMRVVQDADTFNRQEGLEDLKFRFGDQWPVQLQNSRQLEARPMFTINETDGYCRRVINGIRQMRPRGKAHPVNDTSDVKVAKVITGIGRHIEVNSDADNAYDLGAEFAVTIGWGYWRVLTDYVADDSFDQDIYIGQIDNPFSVYFDPNSSKPDGSDAERVLVTDLIPRRTFEKEYPGADAQPFREGGSGDARMVDWITKEDIRIAEYMRIEKDRRKLLMLTDRNIVWDDEFAKVKDMLAAHGVAVAGERESWRKKVMWYKVSGFQELEKRALPGKWLPVIPCYGVNMMVDGKRRKFGMVRFARDPQRMVNFWETSITEALAMQPKAKWLVQEGTTEGHENEWAQANNKAFPVLYWKSTGVGDEAAQKPEYIPPAPLPQGMLQASMNASQALQRVMGMFDPVNLKHTGPKSGEAIRQETGQSEESNYHFYDNLTRSIKHTWRIILDYTPHVYDTERVMRVIGADGKPDLVTINERQDPQAAQQGQQAEGGADGEDEAIGKVLNDVRVGDYDVVMETGPGYNTKQQEALALFNDLLRGPLGEPVAKVGADLVIRMIDAHGMDTLADRLAASNPLAQIDDKSDVPPKAQMQIKMLEGRLKEVEGLLQQAGLEIKFKHGLEKIKQEGEDGRTKMEIEAKGHDVALATATKRHDTEIRALTQLNVAELNGIVNILTKHIQGKQDAQNAERTFEENARAQDKEIQAKASQDTEKPLH